jgi:hypothetical protein
LPDILAEATIQSAIQDTSAASGGVSPSVAALTEGVLQMMFRGKLKLIAAAVFTAVGLAIAVGSWAQQATNVAPTGALNPGSEPAAKSRWIGSFSNGSTVEVVGISTYPAGPKTWWGPDGSTLAEAPCDPPEKHITAEDTVYMVIAVRWTGEPVDSATGWSILPSRGSSGEKPRRAGKEIPGLRVQVVALPRGLEGCAVEFKLAAGAWKTVHTEGSGPSSAGANRRSYMFSEPIATRSGVIVVVTHNIEDQDVRLVAVDRQGKEHLPVGHHSSVGAGGFKQIVREFDLPPAEAEEFRLQTRSYEHLEIKDVALKPPEW